MSLPPPPWAIAGRTVDLVKRVADKTLTIVVTPPCHCGLTDAQVVELEEFCAVTRMRFEAVLPVGWKVL